MNSLDSAEQYIVPDQKNSEFKKFLDINFVRIEIRVFLKFVLMEISDEFGGFLSSDELQDENVRMTEEGVGHATQTKTNLDNLSTSPTSSNR